LNVLRIEGASHELVNPDAKILFISKLGSSLVGQTQTLRIIPHSLAFESYQVGWSVEKFQCTYGLNEAFRDTLDNGKLKIVAVDEQNQVRLVELRDHRFFMATLFMPQLSSTADKPHPLIVAYLKAIL
jgi:CTP synthase (UTP-ammonia lyase)